MHIKKEVRIVNDALERSYLLGDEVQKKTVTKLISVKARLKISKTLSMKTKPNVLKKLKKPEKYRIAIHTLTRI